MCLFIFALKSISVFQGLCKMLIMKATNASHFLTLYQLAPQNTPRIHFRK